MEQQQGDGYGIYLDGLLEGHESGGYKIFYQIWMFCYLAFSTFGVVSSFATMHQPRFCVGSIVISVAIIGFVVFSLFLVKNYRVMNMDPVWRRAAFAVMFLTVLLSVSNALLMHQSFEPIPEATVCPTPAPVTTTTAAPGGSTTAAPGGSTTTGANHTLEAARHHYRSMHHETHMP